MRDHADAARPGPTALISPEQVQQEQSKRIDFIGVLSLAAISLALALIAGRVTQLQVAPSDSIESHMTDRSAFRDEMARRGQVLDRRGRPLAASRSGRRVFVDPLRFPRPYGESIVALSGAIDRDADEVGTRIMQAVAKNQSRKQAGESQIRYVRIPGVLDDEHVASVQRLALPGVHLERLNVRESPSGYAASAIVGKVGVDHDGLLGAELAFESELSESSGKLTYVHDARGRPLWLDHAGRSPSASGDDLRLSIDVVLQEMAVEELERGMDEANAAGGRLVAMDPVTGELLAMVDLIRDLGLPSLERPKSAASTESIETPAYDPETRYQTIPKDEGRLVHPSLGRNRCVEDVYEPGSTFKPFLWSAVTELGLATADEVFDTESGLWRTSYGRPIRDVVELEEQTWLEVLVNSSNIGMVKGVERLTHKQTRDAIHRFGFGASTELGLPGEASGLVTSTLHWSKYTQTSVSFGYEVAVTPVQMVRAFSTFARPESLSGTMASVRLTASPPDDPWRRMVHRVLPHWTADLAKSGMERVGANLDRKLGQAGVIDTSSLRYDIFGKSGTARVPRTDGGGYFEKQYFSSFIAGAPVREPRIIVLVVIDDPGPERVQNRAHFGSQVAGPVVRRFVERALAYMGTPESRRDVLTSR